MNHRAPNPLEALYTRLTFLGKMLSVVCCLWIAVVGAVLIHDLTPDDLEHHRAPVIQDRVSQCEGSFARRYACADAILVDGEHRGAGQLLLRLGLTLMLPAVAWVMWRGVMARAERLRTAVRHSWN